MQDGHDLLVTYLQDARRRYSANTIARRRSIIERLAAAHDLLALQASDLEEWLDTLPLCPRSRNGYLSDVAALYRWAVRRGHVAHDPTVDTMRSRTSRYLPRPIPDPELVHVLGPADERMRAWLCLMAYGGLRCCEVAGLHAEDIIWHLDPPTIHLNHGTKGGHERLVPLSTAAEVALHAFGLPRRGPIFTHADGRQVSAKYVSNATGRYLHGFGIGSTAHALRHYFGTAAYQATGKDLRAVQELLGHASPATTSIYVAWTRSEASTAVRSLGSVVASPPCALSLPLSPSWPSRRGSGRRLQRRSARSAPETPVR